LRRRAIEGGSYRVRASLCQTAMWIGEDGPCMDPAASQMGTDPSWMTVTATGHGELEHMLPVAQLSKTPAHWVLPSPPLGSHEARWV
jgi:hypothetical protein